MTEELEDASPDIKLLTRDAILKGKKKTTDIWIPELKSNVRVRGLTGEEETIIEGEMFDWMEDKRKKNKLYSAYNAPPEFHDKVNEITEIANEAAESGEEQIDVETRQTIEKKLDELKDVTTKKIEELVENGDVNIEDVQRVQYERQALIAYYGMKDFVDGLTLPDVKNVPKSALIVIAGTVIGLSGGIKGFEEAVASFRSEPTR